MKKYKLAALIAAACMTVGSVVGCGSSAASAITFRDTVIDENEFCYMMSSYKAMYLYGYFGQTSDNPQLWSTEMAEGVTVGDYLSALAVSNIMSSAVYIELFDDYGLTLTNDEINTADAKIDQLVSSVGSRSALNKQLANFGANIDTLRSVLVDSLKVTKLQEYLYGENGINAATSDEIEAYYDENYMRCKFIFISSKQEYEYDENGDPIYDSSTNTYKTRELTSEERTEKEALAADLEKRIAAGEDFEMLLQEYTMDTGMLNFEDGYYFTSASTYIENDVKTAVAEMTMGETRALETESGWYIVKRYELRDGAWADEKYAAAMFGSITSTVNTIKMNELIAPYAEEIIVNKEIIASYPIAYCTPNFNY